MATEKKWLAVIVEVQTYEGEVQSIVPVDIEATGYFSKPELEAIHKYLDEDDDADFEFMCELNSLVDEAIELTETP